MHPNQGVGPGYFPVDTECYTVNYNDGEETGGSVFSEEY